MSTAPKLSDVTAKYIEKRGDGLTKDRADAIKAAVRDLIELTADLPVDRYTAAHAEAFEEVMRTLPANWTKRPGLRHLTLRQAAKQAKALGMERQKAKTLRQKWSDIGSIFKHASIKHPLNNPFIAQALLIEDKKEAANAQKTPSSESELRALLASKLPGNLHWMTWLGLYTGARLNEICQLSTSNFRSHGDITYIYFGPEMRLKTGDIESCVRSIPLHADLIQIGLKHYVAGCQDLLFPSLPQHRSGRYSDSSSKAFRRHLQAIGIKRPKLSFHSLRHNFSAAMKRHAPRDVETRERLLGHADSSVAGRYGDDYEAEAHDMVLLEERGKVLHSIKFRVADET